jgi:hypothetical protein
VGWWADWAGGELLDVASDEEQGNEASHAERGIDQSPAPGNVTCGSEYPGPRNDQKAGQKSPRDQPGIADRIAEQTDEAETDNEWPALVHFSEGTLHLEQPGAEKVGRAAGSKEADKEIKFGAKGNGSETAHQKSRDKEEGPRSDAG